MALRPHQQELAGSKGKPAFWFLHVLEPSRGGSYAASIKEVSTTFTLSTNSEYLCICFCAIPAPLAIKIYPKKTVQTIEYYFFCPISTSIYSFTPNISSPPFHIYYLYLFKCLAFLFLHLLCLIHLHCPSHSPQLHWPHLGTICHKPFVGETFVRGHTLGWPLLQSSHDEFTHSRGGVCGLRTLGRIDRNTKEIQRLRIIPGGQLSEH